MTDLALGGRRRVKLKMTYSAWREMEQIAGAATREIGSAIAGLGRDPHPVGHDPVLGQRGCFRLAVVGWWILYHVGRHDESVTVLGVLGERRPTLH